MTSVQHIKTRLTVIGNYNLLTSKRIEIFFIILKIYPEFQTILYFWRIRREIVKISLGRNTVHSKNTQINGISSWTGSILRAKSPEHRRAMPEVTNTTPCHRSSHQCYFRSLHCNINYIKIQRINYECNWMMQTFNMMLNIQATFFEVFMQRQGGLLSSLFHCD